MADAPQWTITHAGLHPGPRTIALPAGRCEIRGRSGSGKTTLMWAWLLATTGYVPGDGINGRDCPSSRFLNGGIVASATVTIPGGLTVGWACPQNGRETYSIAPAGGARDIVAHDDVALRLSKAIADRVAKSQHPDARKLGAALARQQLMAIAAPGWLAEGLTRQTETDSRPYRDLLTDMLAGPDAVREWLEARLEPDEPRAQKAAEVARTKANADEKRAEGALQAILRQTDLRPETPDEDTVERARAAVAALDAAAVGHAARKSRHAAAKPAHDAWRQRAEAHAAWLARAAEVVKPAQPKPTVETMGPLIRERDAADAALAAIVTRQHDARGIDADRRTAATLTTIPCRGRIVVDDDGAEIDCSLCSLITDAQAARDRVAIAPPAPTEAEVAAAKTTADAATTAHNDAVALLGAWASYDMASAALGAEPPAPGAEPERPADPGPEPDGRTVQRQRDIIRAADNAAILLEAWERRQTERAAELERLRAAHAAAQIAAARAEEVLRLVRDAPGSVLGERVDQMLEGYPDLRMTVSPSSVTIFWRGRRWVDLSSGERVVASCLLQDALRRTVRMSWVPVWADDAQLGAGDGVALPDCGSRPLWIIRGADIDGLEVVHG